MVKHHLQSNRPPAGVLHHSIIKRMYLFQHLKENVPTSASPQLDIIPGKGDRCASPENMDFRSLVPESSRKCSRMPVRDPAHSQKGGKIPVRTKCCSKQIVPKVPCTVSKHNKFFNAHKCSIICNIFIIVIESRLWWFCTKKHVNWLEQFVFQKSRSCKCAVEAQQNVSTFKWTVAWYKHV